MSNPETSATEACSDLISPPFICRRSIEALLYERIVGNTDVTLCCFRLAGDTAFMIFEPTIPTPDSQSGRPY